MTATTLGALAERILDETKQNVASGQSQLPFIKDSIRSAIRLVNGSRLWFLEKTDTDTLLTSTNSVVFPSDYAALELLRVKINGKWTSSDDTGFSEVGFHEFKDLARDDTQSGPPRIFTQYAGAFLFFPYAADDYIVELNYCKKDTTEPSSDSDTSVWFDDGQDVIRLKAKEIYYRDHKHSKQHAGAAAAAAKEAYESLKSRNNSMQTTYRLELS